MNQTTTSARRATVSTTNCWLALVTVLGIASLHGAAVAQRQIGERSTKAGELAHIPGGLVLAAPGALSAAARSAFVQLAEGGTGRIVVLSESKEQAPPTDWLGEGSHGVQRFEIKRINDLTKPSTLTVLLAANGIWLNALPKDVATAPLMRSLLVSAMERGAAIGAAGNTANLLTGIPGVDASRMCLAPRLQLVFGSHDSETKRTHQQVDEITPAHIAATMPKGAAIAVYGGRRVALLGTGEVTFSILRQNKSSAHERVLACQSSRDMGDPLDYQLDLLSWIRRAQAAERPPCPPAQPAAPRLDKGTLIVQGGGGVTEDTWRRFIELAGGTDAQSVCIPSAGNMDNDAEPSSHSARNLEQLNCSSVRTVHVARRAQAEHDGKLIEAIDSANAVWIDGGRTFRFMDRFGKTEAGRTLARALERGGVVGGSSAGCQVVGDFLVRGDPRSNRVLTDPGYLAGLGLIQGVAFDAHFRERGRETQFGQLIAKYPQMLGIGVDAETALLIQGTKAEVLGLNGVNVFDRRDGRTAPEKGTKHESGDRFDPLTGRANTKKR